MLLKIIFISGIILSKYQNLIIISNEKQYHWVLGKIQIIENEVLISVNSIERALFALKYFNTKIKKNIIYFESADIHNKLYANNKQNVKIYDNIETFFDNKEIENHTQLKLNIEKFKDKTLSEREKQSLRMDILKNVDNEQIDENENIPINFHEYGLKSVRFSLEMKQQRIFNLFQKKPGLTIGQLISQKFKNLNK